jgi:hypothetical protein
MRSKRKRSKSSVLAKKKGAAALELFLVAIVLVMIPIVFLFLKAECYKAPVAGHQALSSKTFEGLDFYNGSGTGNLRATSNDANARTEQYQDGEVNLNFSPQQQSQAADAMLAHMRSEKEMQAKQSSSQAAAPVTNTTNEVSKWVEPRRLDGVSLATKSFDQLGKPVTTYDNQTDAPKGPKKLRQ